MRIKQINRKISLLLAMLLLLLCSMPVLAASEDNSLSELNIHNGTLDRDFQYNIWEYNVTVEPGTTELLLEPTTSNPNASVTSITGTVLENGQATVLINTVSESGTPMTYTLHVTEAEGEESETETETVMTETEAQQVTEMVTEAETETETEASNALQAQVSKLKADSDLMIKILYGLIALTLLLLFFMINLILKNRDLKDDLKDAEEQLSRQTNEFARKERMMMTDQYYAPTQQPGMMPNQPYPMQQPGAMPNQPSAPLVDPSAPAMEETFGSRTVQRGYQGMQPEDVPPNLPITEEPQPTVLPEDKPEPQLAAAPTEEALPRPTEEEKKSDVDITMVEL